MVQQYHVDVNAVVTAEETGACALHIAAFIDNANATFELLLLGADILQVDSRGKNALDIAKDRPNFLNSTKVSQTFALVDTSHATRNIHHNQTVIKQFRAITKLSATLRVE